MELCFRIADGQISSIFDKVICTSVFSFLDDNFSKCQWIFIKLGFGIANRVLKMDEICPLAFPK